MIFIRRSYTKIYNYNKLLLDTGSFEAFIYYYLDNNNNG